MHDSYPIFYLRENYCFLIASALKDACGFTNPIQATHEEIVAIYRAAM